MNMGEAEEGEEWTPPQGTTEGQTRLSEGQDVGRDGRRRGSVILRFLGQATNWLGCPCGG